MKTKILLTVLLALFVSSANQVSGQRLLRSIIDKTQQKVEEKVENKVMDEVDKGIDKSLDKISESIGSSDSQKSDSQRSQERMSQIMRGMGIAGDPVPIADSYNFDQLIQMSIESFDGTGTKVSSGDFITLMDNNSKNMAYQAVSGDVSTSGQGIFIIDTENKATIILNDEAGNKTGIVYGLGVLEMPKESYNAEPIEDTPEYYAAHPNVKKTGQTKRIAGYTCEQFSISDENTEGDIWITRDLKMNTGDFLSMFLKVQMASVGMGWGYLMESTSVQKDTGEKSVMTVTKVDPSANRRINLSDYSITNMGNITIPTE